MKFNGLKKKLWFNIFTRIAVIFAVFVLVLSLSNVTLLVSFFSAKEKKALKEQLAPVETLDFNDTTTVISALSEINEKFNFDVEIYNGEKEIKISKENNKKIYNKLAIFIVKELHNL